MTEPAPSTPEKAPVRPAAAVTEDDAAALQKAADQQAQEDRPDETVPGGKYVVDGQWVNAEGQPLTEAKK
jgi:hypothetical protein